MNESVVAPSTTIRKGFVQWAALRRPPASHRNPGVAVYTCGEGWTPFVCNGVIRRDCHVSLERGLKNLEARGRVQEKDKCK